MISFGMLAMFFFLALYMQNILGYSPARGRRSASSPPRVVIIVAGPIAGRLADRIGPRPLMVAGLLIVAASLALAVARSRSTRATASSSARSCCMGLGMGLVMSPMSMAAMNAVDRTKAGVASGTLSMFRMVGGTFGVAALGALVAAIGRHDLEQSLPARPAPARATRSSTGSARAPGSRGAPPQVVAATHSAFVDALGTGLTISAASHRASPRSRPGSSSPPAGRRRPLPRRRRAEAEAELARSSRPAGAQLAPAPPTAGIAGRRSGTPRRARRGD